MKRLLPFHRQVLPALALVLTFAQLAALPRPAGAITVTVTADNKMSGMGGCTLREAVQRAFDLAGGNTSTYPECTTVTGTNVIDFNRGLGTITLDKNLGYIFLSSPLTIKGKQQAISGGTETQIFRISGDFTVTLEGLELRDGFIEGGGGAIQVDGGSATLVIKDCDLRRNLADFGGAISFNGLTLDVRSSRFTANGSAKGRGGAIFGGHNWMIKDTIFLGNLALKGGGALDCEGGGELDIERSVFTYNNATGLENDPTCSGQGPPIGCTEGGGAIMSGCKTEILHSLFESNYAYGQLGGGGLLLTDGPKSTITQSVFRWNGAGFGAPTISNIGQGGAIFARGNVFIDSSAIQENWVKGSGGGIFFENSDSQVVNTVLLANQAKLDNGEGSNGGAIAGLGSGLLEITNSSLVDNIGSSELFFFGNGFVWLKNSLIGTTTADSTCDGVPPSQIVNGTNGFDGRNAQSPGIVATCEKVAPELTSTLLADGEFAALLPGGYKLNFQYPLGKFLTVTSGKGVKAVCQGAPVAGKDILGNPRTETCTIGAFEGEAG
jgi:hypothetical protein